jgi:hypothetical protein
MIRSLPSWTALQAVRAQRNYGSAEGETYEESPEEINQRSAKETEILTGNLGDAIIPPHEILADPMQLRILALLQESLVIDGSLVPHKMYTLCSRGWVDECKHDIMMDFICK